jgi:hypothetical protein
MKTNISQGFNDQIIFAKRSPTEYDIYDLPFWIDTSKEFWEVYINESEGKWRRK